MDILRSVRAVAEAEGPGVVDWDRAASAAKEATDPGSIAISDAERAGYAADVRDARSRLTEVAGIEFDVPDTVEVQNRHHWIDASVGTFRRVMDPIEAAAADPGGPDGTFDATPAKRGPAFAQDVSRVANTGSMAFALGFLSRNVLGQYDPLLLADEPDADHGLYFVHPNIVAVASALDVDYPRFRRWIAFHEVTHAAEFGAAPWLPEYLESRVERGVEGMVGGEGGVSRGLDPDAFAELQAAMTAVEGYAEVLMDRAFDGEYADLRAKLDERRGGGGPVRRLAQRLLGLGLKRRQYERGAAFFRHVADERGIEAAGAVWERAENLPTGDELDDPDAWIVRVDP
ncbi:zinc-dependent metalloprotease [Halorubrum ezzemoulense]|uniref:Zinc-dependent metalloprotease n=1 Tax=Halorubrum ezzemoulense TaxID=337243 RepID=A0A256JIP2_HALEZ|nr:MULTISPECIES: zinc-dependent metalloprotease [Halorubrum]MDB2224162.1 zinc-dependent metalloprotease [Halorubrum ezzemoulense]MDB2243814.1 zinc-dependent metalloprotease [Halorubrum ezzemoulense]MDB2251880.1 zinc-dependent metalloprotease [Halorubrum ezzemoulense]MDB2260259.1 zinc-dependent metalloprotease [Halorubrum ezzemoulense]MDB2267348.1 zinc-dependent metalloprotease [Halorubrum ezzemoulense]